MMIGEFARRCRLPVSTLRYYDRIGLLPPADVDPVTGYRRYRLDQLATANRIAELRTAGVAPENIAGILAGGPVATEILRRERARVAADIDANRQRLRRIDELLAEPVAPRYHIEFTDLPVQRVALRPFKLASADIQAGITRAIVGLRSALRRSGHHRKGPWGATFPLDISDTVTGFAFAPIADGDDQIETTAVGGSPAAAVDHHGSVDTLPLAYAAAFAALDEAGLHAIEPLIEEYLTLEAPEPTPRIRLWVPYERH